MQRPSRPKRAFSGRPFPTLSLFAIYCSHPIYPLRGDDDDDDEAGHENDATREAAKVLFFSSAQNELSTERKARLMGTVFGMADFAKMLSHGNAPSVRSVHSQRQRMVWLEVEPTYFVHATIELPRAPRHSRGVSTTTNSSTRSNLEGNAPLDDAALLAALAQAYRRYHLLNGSFTGRVEVEGRRALADKLDSFWNPWVASWNLVTGEAGCFQQVVQALPRSAYATASTSTQLAPLLSQFSASHSSAVPILLYESSVLHLPSLDSSVETLVPNTHDGSESVNSSAASPPSLTETDLLALVDHLVSRTTSLSNPEHSSPTKTPISLPSTSFNPSSSIANTFPPPPSSTQPRLPEPSSEMLSKWSSLYSLSPPSLSKNSLSIPSLSIPSINLPSIPGLSNTPPTGSSSISTSPSGAGSSGGGSGWTGRFGNVSWGSIGLGGGGKKNGRKRGDKVLGSGSDTDGSIKGSREDRTKSNMGVEQVTSASATIESKVGEDLEAQTGSTRSDAVDVEPPNDVDGPVESEPVTPAVEVETNVDSGALAEAMDEVTTEAMDPEKNKIVAEDAALEAAVDKENETGLDAAQTELPSLRDASVVEEPRHDEERVVQESSAVEATRPEATRLFCGSGDLSKRGPLEVRTFQRGSFTLALVTQPLQDAETIDWLTSRSTRLLEAVETIVDPYASASTPFPYRYLIKSGQLSSSNQWSSKEESWSGKATIEDQDINGALFDCVRGTMTEPTILESCIRLASSQWVVSKRIEDTISSTSVVDVYAVLPAKIGKDGSLVDAGEELRRLERFYPKGMVE